MDPHEQQQSAPSVSVVIPTYRRPDLLARCLETALAQDTDEPYEVIVVDDARDDRTRAQVEALAKTARPSLRYLRAPQGRGPSVARNHGWRSARAPLVAFTDDDTIPATDWLSKGLHVMRTTPHAAVCGRVVVPVEDDEAPTDHELMTLGLQWAEFVTANAFVRRDALDQVGGFDERFTRAWREDSDLQFRLMRAGFSVARCGDATVTHPVRKESWGVCLRQQRNAFFDALLYKKHPRLYRERIRRQPPWNYYAIVGLTAATPLLALDHLPNAAATAFSVAALLVLQLAWKRLRNTSRAPAHVIEMVATSALIPFLSVYWRMRGAWRFKTLFL